MTDDRLEQNVRSWLADEAARMRLPVSLREDVEQLAAGASGPVAARVVARLDPTVNLRLPWLRERSTAVSNATKLILAAGLVVIAIVGGVVVGGLDKVGAPGDSATPSIGTATPWPSPSNCEGVRSIAADTCRIFGWKIHFPSGRMSVTVDGVGLSVDTADTGWERFGDVSLNNGRDGSQSAEAIIYWTAFPGGESVEPCWFSLDMVVGPSVADAADAVARAPGTEVVTAPSDVEVGGRPGKYVVVNVRDDFGCTPGYFHLWSEPYAGAFWRAAGVGTTIRVWVVDVDGTRLFIAGETRPGVDASFGEEIHAIVESIRFE